jgi:glutathione peroxidase
MPLFDHPIKRLDGEPATLNEHKGDVLLIVNVASKCGLTPQYTGLQKIQEEYGDRGFSVLGFPCNQFLGQEPGTAEEIQEFCSTTYGIDFPLFEKVDVNGEQQHPIFSELNQVADEGGYTGDIRWNFEKFLVAPSGEVVARFNPQVEPEDAKITSAIEANLPA